MLCGVWSREVGVVCWEVSGRCLIVARGLWASCCVRDEDRGEIWHLLESHCLNGFQHHSARRDGAESDQGGSSGRLVLVKSDELNPWMMAMRKESYYQATQDDDLRKTIAQQTVRNGTDFLKDGDGLRCGTCAFIATDFRVTLTFGGSRRGTAAARATSSSVTGSCVACGGQYNWMDPNRVFVTQDGAGPARRRCFGLTHTHTTAGCVRESGVCSKSAGPFAKRWGQPRGHDHRRSAGAQQDDHHERAKEV